MIKKSNKSRTYLLPLIAPIIGIKTEYYKYINNTFILDSENKYKDCIFIHHEFAFRTPEFIKYEHEIIDNQLFIESIDVNDEVIYIYKFPKEYIHEYNQYKESKYSTFFEDAKKQIIKFWTIIKGKHVSNVGFILKVKQILYKEKILKNELEKQLNVLLSDEAELGNFVDLDKETINLDNFRNKQITVLKKEE